jgi:gluconolactonase
MNGRRLVFFVLAMAAVAGQADGQLLPAQAAATRLVTGHGCTEGPLFDPAGGAAGSVLFTDLSRADIVRYDIAAGRAAIVDPNSGAANGMYFDAGGYLVTADRDRRQISRRSLADITVVEAVLANNWQGAVFNGPNDLVIDEAGGIYFSDPDYNSRGQIEAVYYINPAGVLSRLLTGFSRPNGVALSPDGNTFYLAAEAQKRIFAWDVAADGSLSNQRQFARTDVNAAGAVLPGITNGPDGLTVDPSGNVYAAVQNAVFAWNPSGSRLFSLSVTEDPTNVELGGRNGKTLYITAGASLFRVGLNVVPKLPGDFDYDGDVDAADLAPWRAAFGQTGAALDADADGDGAVGGADFLAWQRRVDASPGDSPGVGVPEPATWTSAACALTTLGAVGARMRRRARPNRSLASRK